MALKNELFIRPLETQRQVGNQINTSNISQNIGLERKAVSELEQQIHRYKELRDTEQIISSKASHQEQITDGQDFLFRAQHDEKFKKDPNNFKEFTKRYEQRVKQFKELANNDEYAEDITNITVENLQKEYERIRLMWSGYVLEEDRKIKQKQFFYLQDAMLKNSSKYTLNGAKSDGLKLNLEHQREWINAAERGDISVPQAIELTKKAKLNYLISDVNSFINVDGGMEILDKMGAMSFDEFEKHYKSLKTNYKSFKQLLTVEDYKAWKSSIDGAKRDIKAKSKQQEELMKYNQYQQEKDIRDNPVSFAAKRTPITSFGIYSPYTVTQQVSNRNNFAVEVTNNKYGTNYTNIKDMEFGDYLPVTIDKSNKIGRAHV